MKNVQLNRPLSVYQNWTTVKGSCFGLRPLGLEGCLTVSDLVSSSWEYCGISYHSPTAGLFCFLTNNIWITFVIHRQRGTFRMEFMVFMSYITKWIDPVSFSLFNHYVNRHCLISEVDSVDNEGKQLYCDMSVIQLFSLPLLCFTWILGFMHVCFNPRR